LRQKFLPTSKPTILFEQEAEKVRQQRSRIVQTLNVPKRFSEVGIAGGAFPFAKIHSGGERPTRSAVCTSFGPSLAAALLDGLFEHPAGMFSLYS